MIVLFLQPKKPTGNGKLAFGMDKKEIKFYLKTPENGYVSSYVPTLEYKLKEKHTVESKAVVMDLKGGTVLVITAYDVVSLICWCLFLSFNYF